MYDIFSFPNITGRTSEEKIAQIYDYLIKLKEELEFQLSDISEENLSNDLVAKLNSLGADIVKSTEERDEQILQVASRTFTISDVINSPMFKAEMDIVTDNASADIERKVKESIAFTVNFETGNLEYTTS